LLPKTPKPHALSNPILIKNKNNLQFHLLDFNFIAPAILLVAHLPRISSNSFKSL